MATDLNKILILGRLTRDPEIRDVGQSKVANFSIANNKSYIVNGEKKNEVSYFDCEAWSGAAEIIKKYTSKGKMIAVEGRLVQQNWEAEGKKFSKIKIRVENLQLLGGQSSSSESIQENDYSNYQTDINEEDSVF
jgi:single-strand DNA-binding protein